MSRKSLRNVLTYLYKNVTLDKHVDIIGPNTKRINVVIPHLNIQTVRRNNEPLYLNPIIENRANEPIFLNPISENRSKELEFLNPIIENRFKSIPYIDPIVEDRFATFIEEDLEPDYVDYFIQLPKAVESDQNTYTGWSGYTLISYSSVEDKADVCLMISNTYWSDYTVATIGEFGVKVIDENKLQLFNSGARGQTFVHKVITPTIIDEFLTAGYTTYRTVSIPNHPDVAGINDLCIGLYPIVNGYSDFGDYGEIGIKLMDKNTMRVFNTGLADLPLRYFHADDEDIITHGTAQFPGRGLVTTISIPDHELIERQKDLCVMITPIVEDIEELRNLGAYGFSAASKNSIRVYNTGIAINYFKYVVVKRDYVKTVNIITSI